jgi:hypothetical protein
MPGAVNASSVNFPCGDHPAWFGSIFECAIIKAGLDGGKTYPWLLSRPVAH